MVRNLTIVAIILVCVLAGLAIKDVIKTPNQELVIFYTSNLRGQIKPYSGVIQDHRYEQIGGFAFIKGYIERFSNSFGINKDNILLLDTGDALFGSAEATLTMGDMPLKLMGQMGYDAMCIGNLEFEYGLEALENFISKENYYKVPMLACNYRDTSKQGENIFRDGIILERAGTKVGIVGLGIQDLARNTRKDNIVNLEITDMATAVNLTTYNLRQKGAEIIILLSHDPIIANKVDVAKVFPEVDIVIGDLISSTSYSSNKPFICPTAPSRGGGIGYARIQKNKSGKWNFATGLSRLFPVDDADLAPNLEILNEINRCEEKIDGLLEEKITESKGVFTHSYTEESTVGSLISDCMREASGAQIALTNSGGIKTSLSEGVVTLRKLFNIMPFENNIIVVELTGAQLENIIEYSLSGKNGFLQSSGLSCTYSSANPAGFRIIQIDVDDQALEYDATYTVAINDFMYNNSLDWPEFLQGKKPQIKGQVRESLVNTLKKRQFIAPDTKKRFNDFQELDETLRMQSLSFDLVNLSTPYYNDGTPNSEYCRLIAEVLRLETNAEFAILPIDIITKINEPIQIVTPSKIISDFSPASKLGVFVYEIDGKTLKTILTKGLNKTGIRQIAVSGLSVEIKDGEDLTIHPWNTAYNPDSIYKVALSEEFPIKIDGLYDLSKSPSIKISSDIRRTFINGLRNVDGKIELKKVFY